MSGGIARGIVRPLVSAVVSYVVPSSGSDPAPLDAYQGMIEAVYSLRLELSSARGRPLIQVRRSSDGALSDIGHDANGDLDVQSLLDHCGAGDGFVSTWYEQKSNTRHSTQSTNSNQVKIVSSGSVLSGVDCTGSKFFDLPSGLFESVDSPANFGALIWMNRTDGQPNRDPFGFQSSSGVRIFSPADDGANTYTARAVNDAGSEQSTSAITYTPGVFQLYGHTLNRSSGLLKAYLNGSTQSTNAAGAFTQAFTGGRLGFAPFNGGLDGLISAAIFTSDISDFDTLEAAWRSVGAPSH